MITDHFKPGPRPSPSSRSAAKPALIAQRRPVGRPRKRPALEAEHSRPAVDPEVRSGQGELVDEGDVTLGATQKGLLH